MNLELFNMATQAVATIGTYKVREDQHTLNKNTVELVTLTDEELRTRCLQAIRGGDTQGVHEDESLLANIMSSIVWFRRRANSLTIRRLALAIEAFKRAPADLPYGSALYSQQIQAASSLTRRCLIQMDTGEGKTYALLPAAFALACDYHRVYIVCANEYLAWRDAHRTRTFWEFVGLQHSLCLGKTTDDWASRIIYTTLPTLIFRHLKNLSEMEKPSAPISFNAILLDEADAILLDQGSQEFALVQEIKAEAFDWSFALSYVHTLVEDEEIETDYHDLAANLTVTGEARLRETLSQNARQESRYLLTRLAVELAYVAVRVAAEDRDYIVEGRRVHAVDGITGRVLRDRAPHWVIPLEVQKGFSPRAEKISMDEISTLTFLKKFQHLSGLSGTIADDALEYLFLYFLPMLVIKPRKSRYQGLKPDLIYRTKAESWESLCDEVMEACEAQRPVLVGTQNIAEAEKIYLMLSEKLSTGVRLNLLTGKNDYETAQILEHGGEVGSVIVATQLAGRGVDIRLSKTARENGGLVLLGLGHSITIRHDKQFLGRAGRQGDPFRARFVCSLQDELLARLVGKKANKMMQLLGMEGGVAVESRLVTRSIAAAQNNYRKAIFWRNQHQVLLDSSSFEIRRSLETWYDYLQLSESEVSPANKCSLELFEWLMDFYFTNVLADVFGRKIISPQKAEQITGHLNASLGLANSPRQFSALDIEARDPESAIRMLKQLLMKKLNDATEESEKMRSASLAEYISSRVGTTRENAIEEDSAIIEDPALEKDPAEEEHSIRDEDQEKVYSVAGGSFHAYWIANERTPRKIAFWSVRSGWIGFMHERSRIVHRVYQKRLSYLEHYRSLTDQITDQWHKSENEIAVRTLRNLLRSAQPWTMDDLFIYEDNRVIDLDNVEKEDVFTWEAGSSPERYAVDPKEQVRLLIGQFVAQAGRGLNDSFNASQLRRLLVDFTEQSPLYTLQTPSQIQKALEAWNVTENERGVSERRRKVQKKWLREFLLFLRERKLIGALPTFQTRLQSALAKFVKNITETRTVLTFLGVIGFLAGFILISYWGDFAQPKQMGPFGTWLDKILFAGLLAKGNIAAPAFGVLILASVVTVFAFPHTADTPKDAVPFERALVRTLQLSFAWWLTDWHYGQMTFMSLMRSLGVFACILAVSLISERVVWLLKDGVGLNLISGWLSFNVLFAFFSAVASSQSMQWTPILLFVTTATAYYFWQNFNQHEIELVSSLLKSSSTSMQVEEISGNLMVKSDCGASPHVYSVLCAWLLLGFLTFEFVSARVSLPVIILLLATVYVVVMVGHIAYIMSRRFSVEMWEMDLNERHQMIKGVYSVAELQEKLQEIKRLLLRRELAFQVLIFIGANCLLYGAVLKSTTFPLGLVVVFSALVFGAVSKDFALQLHKLFYNRVPLNIEVLDFSKFPEETRKQPAWQKFKRAAKIAFASLIAVYGFFEVVTNTYGLLEKLKIIP